MLACWSYILFRINLELDRIIDWLYADILGSYWDPELRLVDTGYRTLSFPFREFRAPRFEMKVAWNFENMIGFMSSWSAVANYKKREGHDPILENKDRLKTVWGDPDEMKNVMWPFSVRAGRIR